MAWLKKNSAALGLEGVVNESARLVEAFMELQRSHGLQPDLDIRWWWEPWANEWSMDQRARLAKEILSPRQGAKHGLLGDLAISAEQIATLFFKEPEFHFFRLVMISHTLGSALVLCGFLQAGFDCHNFVLALGEAHNGEIAETGSACTELIGRNYLAHGGVARVSNLLGVSPEQAATRLQDLADACAELAGAKGSLASFAKLYSDYVSHKF